MIIIIIMIRWGGKDAKLTGCTWKEFTNCHEQHNPSWDPALRGDHHFHYDLCHDQRCKFAPPKIALKESKLCPFLIPDKTKNKTV